VTHIDTSFAIDLLREEARGLDGPATGLLATLSDEPLGLSVFTACELEAGAAASRNPGRERERIGNLLRAVLLVLPDERFPRSYGGLLARITAAGNFVATMDLLIATTAIIENAALVTRNLRHFKPVPGLRILTY
jgi:tRNA(fMet)-specific endonuclease VapC